jgi:group I intron endonuclease
MNILKAETPCFSSFILLEYKGERMNNSNFKNGSEIYKIENLINHKLYIGSAVNFKNRRSRHLYLLKNKNHYNKHLQASYDKHGEENFIFEIIEYVDDKEMLLDREDYYIDLYNSNDKRFGYNQRKIADSNRGLNHTEEAKEKMSIAHRRENLSEETRRKYSEAAKRRVFTEERRRKMSESNKGRVKSDEERLNISLSHMGRKYSDESRRKMSESHKGKKQSEETIEKRMTNMRGENNPNFGKHWSEEMKEKISRRGKKNKNSSSKYHGVSYDKGSDKWMAYVKYKKESIYIGRFKTEIEAARAYNEKVLEVCGEEAILNIIEEEGNNE